MLAGTAERREEWMERLQDIHRPVLLEEVVDLLSPAPGAVVVDATVGAGGHAERLLQAVGPTGRVYGIDRDSEILAQARRRLDEFGDRFVPLHGNHGEIRDLLAARGVDAVDGILADLGVSSLQLDQAERGFSFLADGPLDMRMDRTRGLSAADLVARASETELKRILFDFGEERKAASIARAVVRERDRAPFRTTLALARLVERVAGPAAQRFRIHPATRTFQALRIAVNGELESIEGLLSGAVSLLRPGGRLAVISFHSLEDRAIKHGLRGLEHRCTCAPELPVCGCGRTSLVRVITPRPVVPTDAEIAINPRARSARLRAAERT